MLTVSIPVTFVYPKKFFFFLCCLPLRRRERDSESTAQPILPELNPEDLSDRTLILISQIPFGSLKGNVNSPEMKCLPQITLLQSEDVRYTSFRSRNLLNPITGTGTQEASGIFPLEQLSEWTAVTRFCTISFVAPMQRKGKKTKKKALDSHSLTTVVLPTPARRGEVHRSATVSPWRRELISCKFGNTSEIVYIRVSSRPTVLSQSFVDT